MFSIMTEVHTILFSSPGWVEAMSLLLLTLVRRILVRLKQTSNNFCLFHSEGCEPLCFGGRSAILFYYFFLISFTPRKFFLYIFEAAPPEGRTRPGTGKPGTHWQQWERVKKRSTKTALRIVTSNLRGSSANAWTSLFDALAPFDSRI